MNRKHAQRQVAECQVVRVLAGMDGWVCAKAVAKRLGWPWRVVARALRRAALYGQVECKEEVIERPKQRHDTRWTYRRTLTMVEYPNWLMPKVPPHMQEEGRKVSFSSEKD